ncbi:unnamed protein product [Ceutorhynchus assimilis]|uniref:COMM domain-containing protein n=1 Tax=Ceutorhynchus assimilis TaxID=467358 RepID=A0A9N9MW93_9CUCU|nr:unnamed protein product [Ceutorhynchus assimilis]
MLISLRNDHKEHLQLLTAQPEQVVADFCKLASDFLENGPTAKLFSTAASKLDVTVDVIENCIYGLINLLLIACKHQLSEADFRDSVLTLGFSENQETLLSKFYDTKKSLIHKINTKGLTGPHYHDLQWRFEVQLASRSMLQQVTPLITMDLALKTGSEISHQILQTDPTNLLHLANELEHALNQSRSRHSRKVQRALGNLQI